MEVQDQWKQPEWSECLVDLQDKKRLRCTTYIGGGDTKTCQEVCKSKPYENVEIVKAECIGHIQKRVGSRLLSLKEKYKIKFHDGKKMFGKERLTGKNRNTLQNYYGKAIRQSIEKLYEMKKSVAAVLFYCSETRYRNLT